MPKWFVYILKCQDNSLYTGITNDLNKRFLEHKSGKGSKYVRSRGAKRIVHKEMFNSKSKALKREAAIKRFAKKEKLGLLKKK